MRPIEKAWAEYSKQAFNADRNTDGSDSSSDHQQRKKPRGRTEVTHSRDGIPYLPDIRECSLEEAKGLIREFVTGYYRQYFPFLVDCILIMY